MAVSKACEIKAPWNLLLPGRKILQPMAIWTRPPLQRPMRSIAAFDAQIAAIAASQAAKLATRNVADFLDCGIQVINPWEA